MCPLHSRPLAILTYTHPGVWRYEYGCGCYRMRQTLTTRKNES